MYMQIWIQIENTAAICFVALFYSRVRIDISNQVRSALLLFERVLVNSLRTVSEALPPLLCTPVRYP
jgi:hypothetical protein